MLYSILTYLLKGYLKCELGFSVVVLSSVARSQPLD